MWRSYQKPFFSSVFTEEPTQAQTPRREAARRHPLNQSWHTGGSGFLFPLLSTRSRPGRDPRFNLPPVRRFFSAFTLTLIPEEDRWSLPVIPAGIAFLGSVLLFGAMIRTFGQPEGLSALFMHLCTHSLHSCHCRDIGIGSSLWQNSHPRYRITTFIQLGSGARTSQ